MAQRNATVDIARGIAILLVVFGHAGIESHVRAGIYLFHMPLFFFLSGLFLCPAEFDELRRCGSKILRIRQLYVPFVRNMLLLLLLSPMLYSYNITSVCVASLHELLEKSVVILRFRVGCVDLLGHYWFLPVLFFSHLLSLLVVSVVKSKKKIEVVAVLLFFSGYVLCNNYGVKEPYDFTRILYYAGFYLMGFIGSGKLMAVSACDAKSLFVLCTIGIIALCAMALYANLVFTHAALFLLASTLGIATTIGLAALLAKAKCLRAYASYIGRHTMVIFTWHVFVFKIVEYALSRIGALTMTLGWNGSFNENTYWWLYSLCGVIVPLGIQYGLTLIKYNGYGR